jgi:hypothetical protein
MAWNKLVPLSRDAAPAGPVGGHARDSRRGGLLTLAVACLLTVTPAAAEPVSFAKDIVPILKTRCVMCHLTGKEPGSVQLHPKSAHASLVGVKSVEVDLMRVEPGKPADSYLYRKIEGTHADVGGSGAPMPSVGSPLTPEQIALVRRWIEEGAPNN